MLERFDEIVTAVGGRVYLAKDARLSRESLEKMYPQLAEFISQKAMLDPEGHFGSDLSRRLEITS